MNQKQLRKAKEAAGLLVGSPAPLFSATDQHDEPFELSQALKKGPVVLIFYRGQWCPFCNKHLRALQDNLDQIYDRGATVVAVSPETSEFLRRTMQKTGAQFTLLHDQDYQIADAFDVTFQPGSAQRLMLNTVLGAQLKKAHDNEQELLPIPATYLIGSDGRIAWRHFDPDYKKRSQVQDILAALDR